MPAGRYSTFVDALSDRKKGPLWEAGKDYTQQCNGLNEAPKRRYISSLHAPSSGRFNLRDLSARRGVVLYAYRTHTDSALTSIPSGAISFCQEHSGLPVTRFCLLKSGTSFAVNVQFELYFVNHKCGI